MNNIISAIIVVMPRVPHTIVPVASHEHGYLTRPAVFMPSVRMICFEFVCPDGGLSSLSLSRYSFMRPSQSLWGLATDPR